jgi:hypothetical protein
MAWRDESIGAAGHFLEEQEDMGEMDQDTVAGTGQAAIGHH